MSDPRQHVPMVGMCAGGKPCPPPDATEMFCRLVGLVGLAALVLFAVVGIAVSIRRRRAAVRVEAVEAAAGPPAADVADHVALIGAPLMGHDS